MGDNEMIEIDDIIIKIKKDEGFRGDPYNDHLGIPTIGYGTKLPLSKLEATVLARMRLSAKIEELKRITTFNQVQTEAQVIIIEMSYQMGVTGVKEFKKMWKALDNKDYKEASRQMLDSLWAKQTPGRAEDLSKRMAVLS
jgi:lysozyme